MNTRFKIICILFGIAYLYFIGVTIIDGVPDFKNSFMEGANQAIIDSNGGAGKVPQFETIVFDVQPASGSFTFPSSILNLKTGDLIRTEISTFNAKVDRALAPAWIKTATPVFMLIFVFPSLFAIAFIPVQIFRVIRSIVKNEIFDARNVNRIRWIGYSLLLIFVMRLFENITTTVEARALVSLENYKIVFKFGEELYTLLFALVTFMFAEILKLSHAMKEEQDLTI